MTELAARLTGTTSAPAPAPAPNAGTATATVAAGPDMVARAADAGLGGDGAGPAGDEALVAEELLVEEVSIDGMCGVY
jgi:mycofactocin precursor